MLAFSVVVFLREGLKSEVNGDVLRHLISTIFSFLALCLWGSPSPTEPHSANARARRNGVAWGNCQRAWPANKALQQVFLCITEGQFVFLSIPASAHYLDLPKTDKLSAPFFLLSAGYHIPLSHKWARNFSLGAKSDHKKQNIAYQKRVQ
ncbi:hypothetical protein BC940DRAFT_308339 [Gongronella butleri]|nr:hypothetical protein BC940DRAFT_308339 [Gongronella butleri]